ncbi:MAG: histidine--tRNA ligase [Odoribacteraceae bacterium]|jgi:histidyl-tRNA synthetase|nr:histidine--tRNA ligase [Odoribacteraceae bacterium]
MAQLPSIPKGTRDYAPDVMVKRDYIFNTVKRVFQRHGFLPLETPAMEHLATLLGKYGEEGDKLLFKVLNSGNFLAAAGEEELDARDAARLAGQICEKGLRYDLTVPLARFVVQHQADICFPFKRYQIQPVWRADRPQKGRYREFFQCDVDVVGSDSLLNEAELIQIVDEVFQRLRVRVRLLLNNRKILAGIAETIGQPDRLTEITVAVDKMDKIGAEGVNAELSERGLPPEAIRALQPILHLRGDNGEVLEQLRGILAASEIGMKGVQETETILQLAALTGTGMEVKLDLTLARGLSYYTGAIFEVKALDAEMGSITGGGRYDDLTGIFGMKGVSGVGISFGADRVYDVMTQLQLFPGDTATTTRFLFVNFGDREARFCLPLLRALRESGHNAEMYPEAAKLKKQMGYADRKSIPFVVLVGEQEMANNTAILKDMKTGEQRPVPLDNLETWYHEA